MTVIYIDTLFFTDFSCDYLILCLSCRLSGLYAGVLRKAAAAAAGALMLCVIFFLDMPPLLGFAVKMLPGAVMAFVTAGFGVKKAASFFGVTLFLTAAMGGVILAVGSQPWPLFARNGVLYPDYPLKLFIPLFAVFMLVFSLVFSGGKLSTKKRKVRVVLGKKETVFFALLDTGNLLTDPISGKKVIIVSPSALGGLFSSFGESIVRAEKDPEKLIEKLRLTDELNLRLVPYVTPGGKRGMMAAFSPDGLFIDGRKAGDFVVGLMEVEGAGCAAIIGA